MSPNTAQRSPSVTPGTTSSHRDRNSTEVAGETSYRLTSELQSGGRKGLTVSPLGILVQGLGRISFTPPWHFPRVPQNFYLDFGFFSLGLLSVDLRSYLRFWLAFSRRSAFRSIPWRYSHSSKNTFLAFWAKMHFWGENFFLIIIK